MHFRRMGLEKIGAVPVSAEKLRQVLPGLRPGHTQAISDISIANRMTVKAVAQPRHAPHDPFGRMIRLADLADRE
jgi:hypothetical protein